MPTTRDWQRNREMWIRVLEQQTHAIGGVRRPSWPSLPCQPAGASQPKAPAGVPELRMRRKRREAERFQRLVHAVINGDFREYLETRGDRSATLVWE